MLIESIQYSQVPVQFYKTVNLLLGTNTLNFKNQSSTEYLLLRILSAQ